MVFNLDGNPYMQGNWKWNSQEGSTDGKGVQFDEKENIVYSGDIKNFVPHGKGSFL